MTDENYSLEQQLRFSIEARNGELERLENKVKMLKKLNKRDKRALRNIENEKVIKHYRQRLDGSLEVEVTTMQRTCRTCQFFDSKKCRRESPKIVARYGAESGTGIWSGWPLVSEEDWCGEYESREVRKGDRISRLAR